MSTSLFVYGTLAPGRPNEHVLREVLGTWEPGVVRGDLAERGWGAAHGFPALVLRDDGPEVRGYLFHADALDEHLTRLDDFEGPGYERVLTSVTRDDGSVVDAWVYVDHEGRRDRRS